MIVCHVAYYLIFTWYHWWDMHSFATMHDIREGKYTVFSMTQWWKNNCVNDSFYILIRFNPQLIDRKVPSKSLNKSVKRKDNYLKKKNQYILFCICCTRKQYLFVYCYINIVTFWSVGTFSVYAQSMILSNFSVGSSKIVEKKSGDTFFSGFRVYILIIFDDEMKERSFY